MQRYETFGRLRSDHQQPSLPLSVFEALRDNFGVSHECFASPLNHFFDSFCSQFPDTDSYFGSLGSFFEFRPSQGSFEVHPPYDQQSIMMTFAHIVTILKQSNMPLSFVVCVRDIDRVDPGRSIEGLAPFIVHSVRLNAGSHMLSLSTRFRANRNQVPLREIVFVSPSDTTVYWIQNTAGTQRWPVTDEKVGRVINGFYQQL